MAQLPDSVDSAGVADELTGPRVSHLPPVSLQLSFPADYPSAVMPDVQLSSLWLSPDSTRMLLDRLEDTWHEQVRPCFTRNVLLGRVLYQVSRVGFSPLFPLQKRCKGTSRRA